MIGAGFIQQMNEAFKYNRALLGKKKSAREIYKEEVKKKKSSYQNQNLGEVEVRILERNKKNIENVRIGRIASLFSGLIIISAVVWLTSLIDIRKPSKYADKSNLFNTKIHSLPNGRVLKIDYYRNGPKAAETFLKDGMKHQTSESYYESGQQFRAALYFYDTLITEVYFYKTGDTINNFPTITDEEVHRIALPDKSNTKKIVFDFYDGKIIGGTYSEKRDNNHNIMNQNGDK